jgi:BRCT domain type II-containing protein
MLVRGDADVPVDTHDVRNLPCSDHLKEIIHRCLGARHKRYDTADALLEALRRTPERLRPGSIDSLRGVHLAFTGRLRVSRRDAIRAARRAGAIVHAKPSRRTTVIVRGRPNPQQVAGPEGGLKLMELKRLKDRGHRIMVISEARFWNLSRT